MRYDIDRDTVELSVEELCLSALVSGDIDCRRAMPTYHERAAETSMIYNKLHSLFGMLYHDKVELCNTSKLDGIYFCVAGRADGIICLDGAYTVDEVITVNERKGSDIKALEYHNARLSCYAYFTCRAKNLEEIRIRDVRFDTSSGDFDFSEDYVSVTELAERYMNLLSSVFWRAMILRDRARERLPKAANAVFPYTSLRDSQTEMIKECYRDIKHGNKLFCQAPTGIGKTVSTLYPAVKCLGEGVADKIFYLTSKQSIRREAYSAMEKMNGAGVDLRTCMLSSRESMCPNVAAKLRGGKLSSSCNPDMCPYAKGYYDKFSYALADIISSADRYDSHAIKSVAEKHGICPYELSLDLSELCDVIICDYNYVFSPTVFLKRYFEEVESRGEKYVFLVDEAHNLPDRAREMFSTRLSTENFEAILPLVSEDSTLAAACISVIKAFENVGHLCDDDTHYYGDGEKVGYSVTKTIPESFTEALSSFRKKCESWLKYNADSPAYITAEELGFKVFEYMKIVECYDKGYITFINKVGESVSLLLYCLDPSSQLEAALEKAQASVLFSATLTPTDYFADILGGGKKTVSVSFRSPFPHENLCVAAVDKISTKYEDRERSYKKISSCIAATASAKAGNYMVFFPSYSYMEKVYKIFCDKYPKVKTVLQKKNMTPQEKEEFLDTFRDDGKLRVGFCVLGGSFSEGIDLPGDRLIGVVVVGVGLPGLSNENNIIRDYYEEKCGAGYDYAYTYPGMNGVFQAVGRVIRTETDKGIAVLIDDRYAEPKYKNLFPDEWKGVKYAGNAQSLAEIARIFWEKQG